MWCIETHQPKICVKCTFLGHLREQFHLAALWKSVRKFWFCKLARCVNLRVPSELSCRMFDKRLRECDESLTTVYECDETLAITVHECDESLTTGPEWVVKVFLPESYQNLTRSWGEILITGARMCGEMLTNSHERMPNVLQLGPKLWRQDQNVNIRYYHSYMNVVDLVKV